MWVFDRSRGFSNFFVWNEAPGGCPGGAGDGGGAAAVLWRLGVAAPDHQAAGHGDGGEGRVGLGG